MVGRRPKPTELKIVTGNPGKRALNDREPQPPAGRATCPPHLQGAAKNEWRRVYRLLDEMGLMTSVDRAGLAAYCQAWGRWVEAEASLSKIGTLIKSPSGYPIQNPMLAIANKAMEQMRSFLVEFGMTPSSRSRIEVGGHESQSQTSKFF